jgi:DMSO reductase family type II enzyme chaperone
MFAYSLTGLKLDGSAADDVVEVEENETTARSAVYQVLAKLFTEPDDESFGKALDGGWAKDLTEAAALLPYPWEVGDARLEPDADRAGHQEEFARLFLADRDGLPALCGRVYASEDAEQVVSEIVRAYQYFGLGTGTGDVPPDHLTSELDYMQYLTFKEAAAPSPRLARSYQRAQLDFLERQLGSWVPGFAEAVAGGDPDSFYSWAVERLQTFVAADRAYVQSS